MDIYNNYNMFKIFIQLFSFTYSEDILQNYVSADKNI